LETWQVIYTGQRGVTYYYYVYTFCATCTAVFGPCDWRSRWWFFVNTISFFSHSPSLGRRRIKIYTTNPNARLVIGLEIRQSLYLIVKHFIILITAHAHRQKTMSRCYNIVKHYTITRCYYYCMRQYYITKIFTDDYFITKQSLSLKMHVFF